MSISGVLRPLVGYAWMGPTITTSMTAHNGEGSVLEQICTPVFRARPSVSLKMPSSGKSVSLYAFFCTLPFAGRTLGMGMTGLALLLAGVRVGGRERTENSVK